MEKLNPYSALLAMQELYPELTDQIQTIQELDVAFRERLHPNICEVPPYILASAVEYIDTEKVDILDKDYLEMRFEEEVKNKYEDCTGEIDGFDFNFDLPDEIGAPQSRHLFMSSMPDHYAQYLLWRYSEFAYVPSRDGAYDGIDIMHLMDDGETILTTSEGELDLIKFRANCDQLDSTTTKRAISEFLLYYVRVPHTGTMSHLSEYLFHHEINFVVPQIDQMPEKYQTLSEWIDKLEELSLVENYDILLSAGNACTCYLENFCVVFPEDEAGVVALDENRKMDYNLYFNDLNCHLDDLADTGFEKLDLFPNKESFLAFAEWTRYNALIFSKFYGLTI